MWGVNSKNKFVTTLQASDKESSEKKTIDITIGSITINLKVWNFQK